MKNKKKRTFLVYHKRCVTPLHKEYDEHERIEQNKMDLQRRMDIRQRAPVARRNELLDDLEVVEKLMNDEADTGGDELRHSEEVLRMAQFISEKITMKDDLVIVRAAALLDAAEALYRKMYRKMHGKDLNIDNPFADPFSETERLHRQMRRDRRGSMLQVVHEVRREIDATLGREIDAKKSRSSKP